MKRYNVDWEDNVIGLSFTEARDLVFLARKGLQVHENEDEIDLNVEEFAELIPR